MPTKQSLSVYRGDTFTLVLRVKDATGAYVDLTGVTPKSQIRASLDATEVIAEFTASLADQTTTPGGLLLMLDATTTAALSFTSAVWDVQGTSSTGVVTTYAYGSVTLQGDVTR